MAAEELRRRMDDDVGAPVERAAQVRRRERVVDDQRRAVLVRDRGDGLEVEHGARRVADRLAEERLGLGPQRRAPGVEVARVDEVEVDRELAEEVLELGQRAAVERPRGDDVIAGLEQREEDRRLRREAAREGDRAGAALEARDALLEHRDRRVHDPRVGVAVLLQVEVRGRALDVLEDVARGLEDRHRARTGVRVGPLAGVDRARVEPELAIRRHRSSRLTDIPPTGGMITR